MENNNQAPVPNQTNTLAIISIVLVFFVPLVSLVLSIISLSQIKKTHEKGRGLAIASLILSILFMIIIPLLVLFAFLSVPVLQKSSRDASRKNDIMIISTSIFDYQSANYGKFPEISEINPSSLVTVTAIGNVGEPTIDTAIYKIGVDCDGTTNIKSYSVSVKLENDSIYCVDY